MKYLLILALIASSSSFVIQQSAGSLCDTLWFYYDGNCYFTGSGQNFASSEQACVQQQAHLASIHSTFENTFVQSLTEVGEKQALDGMTWIGLQYNTKNSSWGWTDGSAFDFQWWMSGAPGKLTKQDCTILLQDDYSKAKNAKGYWDNIDCTNRERKYVCKKRANQ